jgi:hypothetical protein
MSSNDDNRHGNSGDVNAPAWVLRCSNLAASEKRALARYAATHLISAGSVVQMASGTTLNCLMDEIIDVQDKTGPLDLLVITTNLQILAKGRDAYNSRPDIFGTMQIVLTGGTLHPSLDSLTGSYAAKGVGSDMIVPDVVFFGAAGLSFCDRLTIAYHFQDEISTQVAYATRRTEHRVLLCDHTKVRKQVAGCRSDLDLPAMLNSSQLVTILVTVPMVEPEVAGGDNKVDESRIEEECSGFRSLLSAIVHDPRFAGKECTLRYIDRDGGVHSELCLSQIRQEAGESGAVRPIRLSGTGGS